jgi:hypothetical protein
MTPSDRQDYEALDDGKARSAISLRAATAIAAPDAATAGMAVGARRFALALARLRVTRRGLQIALGLLWLLDGALQLQPFMLRSSFATQVLAPAAAGQPHWVAGPVQWAANLVAAHPVAWDVPFGLIQLLLGVGILVPRTTRLALAASLPWALGVWYFGESLSGLASGNASLLTGAPGSILLYAVLAVVAWPRRGRSDIAPARWLPLAWAVLWIGAAVLQALPMNNTGADLEGAILAYQTPSWLAGVETSLGHFVGRNGTTAVVVLVAVEALIGLAALYRRTIAIAAVVGFLGALAIWVLGQDFGQLYTGQATDPNTAPLIALMAIALPFAAKDAADSVGTRVRARVFKDRRAARELGSAA